MNIIWLTPPNPNLMTPETWFAKNLAKAGHTIYFAYTPVPNNFDVTPYKNTIDLVVAAMEFSMGDALRIGKALNVPVYNHMEHVPVWRVGLEPKEDWGFEPNTRVLMGPDQIKNFKIMYQKQVDDWQAATVRSCAGHTLFPSIQHFCKNKNIEYDIHYYAANFDKLQHFLNPKIRRENSIITTARLVPHKRVVSIVRALGKLKNPPMYDLIGYGPEVYNIAAEAKRLNVPVRFHGSGSGGIKEYLMQKAMFSVQIWAGLPVAEGLYYNTPSVCYKQHHMHEVLGDSVLWAKNNDIDDLAEKIQFMIDNPKFRTELAAKGRELMFSNSIGMGTPEHLTHQLEKIMQKGIDKWNPK